jgi:hypothetical protein
MKARKLFSFLPVLFFAAGLPLFAQNAKAASTRSPLMTEANDNYWLALEMGKYYFRAGDMGNALLSFEDARNERRQLFYHGETVLVNLLSIHEVRGLGDNLDYIVGYAKHASLIDVQEVLNQLYYCIPKESLNNSAQAALDAMRREQKYPEADYWIAELYRAEGEPKMAEDEYNAAWQARENLENPDFSYTILYRLAEVQEISENYNGFQKTLALALAGDPLWNQDPDGFTRRAMKSTLENAGIDRFVQMYRFTSPNTDQAHRMLGDYFVWNHDWAQAEEHLAMSFLYAASTVAEQVKKEHYDWEFTSMLGLMNDLARMPEARDYLRQVDFQKTVYNLGLALYNTGKVQSAAGCWQFLAQWQSESEYGRRARTMLNQLKTKVSTGT